MAGALVWYLSFRGGESSAYFVTLIVKKNRYLLSLGAWLRRKGHIIMYLPLCLIVAEMFEMPVVTGSSGGGSSNSNSSSRAQNSVAQHSTAQHDKTRQNKLQQPIRVQTRPFVHPHALLFTPSRIAAFTRKVFPKPVTTA